MRQLWVILSRSLSLTERTKIKQKRMVGIREGRVYFCLP